MITSWASGPTPSTNSTARAPPSPILQSSNGALPNWPWKDACWPSAVPTGMTRQAAQTRLCRRMENHIKELFVFVAHPEAPPDNNAAERSLRPVVISRKVSGGTRSNQGTDTKMTLASLCGTWRAQGFNPLTACRQLLTSPQL